MNNEMLCQTFNILFFADVLPWIPLFLNDFKTKISVAFSRYKIFFSGAFEKRFTFLEETDWYKYKVLKEILAIIKV